MSDTIYKLQKRVGNLQYRSPYIRLETTELRLRSWCAGCKWDFRGYLGNPGSLEFQMPDGWFSWPVTWWKMLRGATATDRWKQTIYCIFKVNRRRCKDIRWSNKREYWLPIVYDGETISYPQVQECNHRCGTDHRNVFFEEADNLTLGIGSLSLQLFRLESSVVGAQLGSQAMASSLKAGAIGLAIVMVFMMWCTYRWPQHP